MQKPHPVDSLCVDRKVKRFSASVQFIMIRQVQKNYSIKMLFGHLLLKVSTVWKTDKDSHLVSVGKAALNSVKCTSL